MRSEDLPVFGNLQGVRVVSAGTNIAGPFACTLFAEQGADVIHVESTVIQDMLRGMGDTWASDHRNTRCISLNIPSQKGKDVLKQLIARADILVEASKGGTWAKWGLTDDVLWKINPRLVIAHVSGFGQTGDPGYVSRPSFDPIGQAFSGFMAINGMPDPQPPYAAKPYTCDYVSALFTAWAVCAALYRASKTGKGESIDIAQYETMARIQANYLLDGVNHGIQSPRLGIYGNQLQALPNVQQCGDGNWVMTAFGGAAIFKSLEQLWGLADDPDFAQPHSVIQKRDGARAEKFVKAAKEFFGGHDAVEACRILTEIGVPCCMIMTYEMMLENEHYQARQTITQWEDVKTKRPIRGVNCIPAFQNNPSQIFRGGPDYGMDNDDILADLGYNKGEIAVMYEEGIIR